MLKQKLMNYKCGRKYKKVTKNSPFFTNRQYQDNSIKFHDNSINHTLCKYNKYNCQNFKNVCLETMQSLEDARFTKSRVY